ncbi:hypothetical protein [Spiroplasma taiwanense]|uniref:Uncharacterized protein n=1 Tax=Spiroplasma taiwanense CT-1 TaxID=1276220 RepID=S5MCS9_9MOLU|nr:hypothetical protein [Spiroplasma taiwanense]AGR41528.1 hypothetical protein STAIW_v1c09420 [Spiroplasma taiwanense CT-1]
MLTFSNVNFTHFKKNYELNIYKVIKEEKINDDKFNFKDIISSKDKINLNIGESDIILISNGKDFRNLKISNSSNIEIKKMGIDEFKVFANKVGEGFISFNSIDASEIKLIKVTVIDNQNDFSLSKNFIEIEKGNIGSIDINTDHISNLSVINKYSFLYTYFENI